MATFDVTLGGHVMVVTKESGAAQRIASAVNDEAEHLFQLEGITAGVRETDRDATLPADPTAQIWALNVSEVVAAIDAADEVASVQHILDAENANPRESGPRLGIVREAEKRIEDFNEPTTE